MSEITQLCQQLARDAEHDNKTYPLEKIRSLLDHTCLQEENALQTITQCCDKADHVAAVCVLPNYVALAKDMLPNTAIATVANFPDGMQGLDEVIHNVEHSIRVGADEIDLVLPYKQYILGDTTQALSLVQRCHQICHDKIVLKVILETGQFPDLESIYNASMDCIAAGANFIKTSTGKNGPGANLETVAAILLAIKQLSKAKVGCKISGGIHDPDQAQAYCRLVCSVFDESWLNPNQLRFGSSKLLDKVS